MPSTPVLALPSTCQTGAPGARDTNCTERSGRPTSAAVTDAVRVVGVPRVTVAGADSATCTTSADDDAAPRSADAAVAPTTSGVAGAGAATVAGAAVPRGLWREDKKKGKKKRGPPGGAPPRPRGLVSGLGRRVGPAPKGVSPQ